MSNYTNALELMDYFRRPRWGLSEEDRASCKAKAKELAEWFEEMPEIKFCSNLQVHAKSYADMYSWLVRRFSKGEISVDDFVIGGEYLEGLSKRMGNAITQADVYR